LLEQGFADFQGIVADGFFGVLAKALEDVAAEALLLGRGLPLCHGGT
jgi:hypothetical protein